jgi:hypothetical protein
MGMGVSWVGHKNNGLPITELQYANTDWGRYTFVSALNNSKSQVQM